MSAISLSTLGACASESATLGVFYTAAIGETGGDEYDDRCAPGQLAVGLRGGAVEYGFYQGVLSRVRVLCGTPKLPAAGSTGVTIGAGDIVPDASSARGSEEALVGDVTCPEDQVVVGISGQTTNKDFPPARDLAAYLRIRCAKLHYQDGAVTLGEAAFADGYIGPPTADSEEPLACEAGRIATGMLVYAGDIGSKSAPASIVRWSCSTL